MTKMGISWPDVDFPPINLWNAPKQMITGTDIKNMLELKIPQPTVEEVLKERGARYGTFAEHANIAQALKEVMWQNNQKWFELANDQKQALEVIMDKVARVLNGDPNYLDNWVDIQGYAKLVEDRLNGK